MEEFWLDLQDRDAVVLELLHLLVPSGGLEIRRIAPRVVVECEEVAADSIVTAVHVSGHLETVRLNISSGVTNGDLAKTTSVDVGLDVTSHGLDVRSTVGGGVVVDDFVAGKVEQSVVVLGELLNCSEETLKIFFIVGWLWGRAVERVLGSVDVEREVDASVGLDMVSVN
jgi:hypothetical protein